jgi:hypothetical protein
MKMDGQTNEGQGGVAGDTGSPSLTGGAGANGQAASQADQGGAWFDSLPDELKTNPGVVRYDSLEKLVTAKLKLDSHIGVPEDQLIRLPANADAAALAKVYDRLGRPESADKYELPAAEGLADLPPEVKKKAQEVFHQIGLNSEQAKALWNLQNEIGLDALRASEGQTAIDTGVAEKTLKAAWGSAYDERLALAQSYIAANADPELVTFLEQTNLASHPQLVRMVGDLVSKIAAPSKLPGAGAGRLTTQGTPTPAEAQTEINQLFGDQQFQAMLNDANHAGHKGAVERWMKLNALATKA